MALRESGAPPPTGGLEHLARLALLLLFLLALAGGAALLVRQGSPAGVEVLLPASTGQVYLTGAVGEAGTYDFQEGDRLEDAIAMAGGATPDADLSQVNLALLLQDQDHFHIPVPGEEVRLPQRLLRPDGTPRLNLNEATTQALQALPGIGEVRAAAVVAYRESQGPFETVEGLMEVPGIGLAVLEGLRELVTVE